MLTVTLDKRHLTLAILAAFASFAGWWVCAQDPSSTVTVSKITAGGKPVLPKGNLPAFHTSELTNFEVSIDGIDNKTEKVRINVNQNPSQDVVKSKGEFKPTDERILVPDDKATLKYGDNTVKVFLNNELNPAGTFSFKVNRVVNIIDVKAPGAAKGTPLDLDRDLVLDNGVFDVSISGLDDTHLLETRFTKVGGGTTNSVEFVSRLKSDVSGKIKQFANIDSGQYTIEVRARKENGQVSEWSDKLKLAVRFGTGINTPEVTAYSNNAFHANKPILELRDGLNVYDGYLRLEGRGVTPGIKPKFRLTKDAETVIDDVPNTLTIEGDVWKAELQIAPTPSRPETTEYDLTVYSQRDQSEAKGTKISKVKLKATPAAVNTPPTITGPIITGPAIRSKNSTFNLTGSGSADEDAAVLVYRFASESILGVGRKNSDNANWTTVQPVTLEDGVHELGARLAFGRTKGAKSEKPTKIEVRSRGPRVEDVIPPNFGTAPGVAKLVVQFTKENKISTATLTSSTIQMFASANGLFTNAPAENLLNGLTIDEKNRTDAQRKIDFDPSRNQLIISIPDLKPNVYQIRLTGDVKDEFGNPLEGEPGRPGTDYVRTLGKPNATGAEQLSTLPSVSRGVRETDAKQVIYQEFLPPTPKPAGFNTGEHVETRVVRLYFFRDAHRVAQIVNRKAKSYNAASVAVRQRLADAARDRASVLTDERRAIERIAADAARLTRESEALLRSQQDRLAGLLAQKTNNAAVAGIDEQIEAARQRVRELVVDVQAKRATEVNANEKSRDATAQEDRGREDMFRKAVAAMREDPDTFAPGDPGSVDPVARVSITVVGESELQLRGPINGINTVRQMIHQIDAPAGQVRIGVHTVQINGERGDRMEKVATKIQDHLDQSRFLTQQSSLMLRKAILTVASRKAWEAGREDDFSQHARDQRYMHAFFGKDFLLELRTLDSEFLRSGNKMLSLHSMDTTSLASGLFIMALAKNGIRREILEEFDRLIETELPIAEIRYLESGQGCPQGCRRGRCNHICLFAQNARFQSFRGFFNSEVFGEDTMTPLQREFVRLAQIFKAQLVTELEVKQRVTERALIEERLGNYDELLIKQKKQEEEAIKALRDTQNDIKKVQANVFSALVEVFATMQNVFSELESNFASSRSANATPDAIDADLRRVQRFYSQFVLRDEYKTWYDQLKTYVDSPKDKREPISQKSRSEYAYKIVQTSKHIRCEIEGIKAKLNHLLAQMSKEDVDIQKAFQIWSDIRTDVTYQIGKGDTEELTDELQLLKQAKRFFDPIDVGFRDLLKQSLNAQFAKSNAAKSRRELDHKKLLDMLIDEANDKQIEMLEGTRAHTANVDNYIKRLSTALEDDFNRQFYAPAFVEVRKASRFWDVTLSQIETTTILTNNRTFAKVEPQATMEFDLPRRDTVLTEAMGGAKAMMDTYGALLNDPSFLALVKMRGGQPTSSYTGGVNTGIPTMRNVLPGLSRSTDEQLIAQGGPGGQKFNSPLENLIPDPAIYKFETGTGFEIRPVIQPDGQAVTFHFNYMYTTNIHEPVRPDEKHLGRVKRHFIDTDVQLGNYELREVSRYQVALKAARTAKGVPLLQDLPGVGVLFRPLPSAESSLQQNLIMAQATIYPTLFDLMGLRWAPAIADVDPLGLINSDFLVRNRKQDLMNRVYDISSKSVDDALRIPDGSRRPDLYRTQQTIPYQHPNGYRGPGFGLRDSNLREGYSVPKLYPETRYVPSGDKEGRTETPPAGMMPMMPGMHYPQGLEGNIHHDHQGRNVTKPEPMLGNTMVLPQAPLSPPLQPGITIVQPFTPPSPKPVVAPSPPTSSLQEGGPANSRGNPPAPAEPQWYVPLQEPANRTLPPQGQRSLPMIPMRPTAPSPPNSLIPVLPIALPGVNTR